MSCDIQDRMQPEDHSLSVMMVQIRCCSPSLKFTSHSLFCQKSVVSRQWAGKHSTFATKYLVAAHL